MQTPTDRRSPRRDWGCILGSGASALVVAGILGSSASAGAATSNAPIGAMGSVAALSGSSMEVQNPSTGQTTVSWTATTSFSKSVTESVSAVSVGDCITATGSASKKSKTTIAARSITLTKASSNGTCGASAGGPFRIGAGSGGPPAGGFRFRTGSGGASNKFPEGGSGPRTFPGGAANNFGKRLANLAIASGKVTAVEGSTLTVSGISISPGSFAGRGEPNSEANNKAKAPTKPKTQTLKVTTTSSTPVNTSQSVTSADLAVGDCVSAFGPASTNGSVTATTVRITSTGGSDCTGGFPGGGEFFGRRGGGGGA